LRSHAARGDVGFVVILRANWSSGQAAQDRNLTDVRQRVGKRTLEQLLGRTVERLLRREVGIEPREPVEEARDSASHDCGVEVFHRVRLRDRQPQSNRSLTWARI
jgi:hypothetical protein